MCNILFDTIFSMHYNRCTNNDRNKPRLLFHRSSPASPSSSEITANLDITTDDITLVNKEHQGTDNAYKEEENDINTKENQMNQDHISDTTDDSDDSDSSDYDQFDDSMVNVCGCGKTLSKGWACGDCRVQCPRCNRALSTDPEDYCSRCYVKYQDHGLILKKNIFHPN